MRIRFKFTLFFILLSIFPLFVAGIFTFQKLSKIDLLFIGFLALLAVVISFFTAKAFALPISELARIANRLQGGDFSQRTHVQSKDEIGKLSQAFNNMAAQLQELSLDLEQKVQAKTIELNAKVKDLENTKKATLNLLEDLETAKKGLEIAKANDEVLLADIQAKTIELNAKVKDLENTKKATLNLLEDLETAKKGVEMAKAKDEAMLANIGEGLVFTNLEKKILLINKAGADILGWEEHELMGKTWMEVVRVKDESGKEIPADLFPLDKIVTDLSPLDKVVTSFSTDTDSYYYTRKNGSTFPVAITASKVSVENKPIGAIIVFRDITKEKEIDKAKTEFVSLASHQLRTPLSTINWYTEMLLAGDAGKINKEQKKYLEEVYQGSKRMVGLVNALLNVSRIEMGTFAIEPEPIDLREAAQIVLKELAPKIKEKEIKVDESYGPDLPIIQFDPKLIDIIFQNLLSNAVKYTPAVGSVSLTVSKDEKDVIIKVADTGYGIPKNQHAKIFSKLFRADNIVSRVTEGTGLGLYIVKSIIDHSGGRIWFESEDNKGTTFYVTLPLKGIKQKKGTKTLE